MSANNVGDNTKAVLTGSDLQDIEFHPYCLIFPALPDEGLATLAQDIKANGLHESIVLPDGKVLDGRNRYLACAHAGVPPKYREFEGDNPLQFVVSSNLHRRHLNTSQRAMIAAEIANMPRGTNQHTQICGPSQAKAAALLKVSSRSVTHARKVHRHGSLELKNQVMSGKLSVSKAAQSEKKSCSNTAETRAINGSERSLIDRLSRALSDLSKSEAFEDIAELAVRCVDVLARGTNAMRSQHLDRLTMRLESKSRSSDQKTAEDRFR